MISEHVAAQAHFEESKGYRHNTTELTGLALDLAFPRIQSDGATRRTIYHPTHPYAAASEVHRETELGRTKDTEEAPSSGLV